MNLLILKGFNNYFNRKIKKYSELDDYKSNSLDFYNFSDINFNPNDGIATTQIIGSENQKEDTVNVLNWENQGSPDYLVCYNTVTTVEDDVEVTQDVIVSRWFVIESVRTRAGQYQLGLKRDVIADNLETILTNPCFIEKGYVPASNKLIFNDEGVSFNEIKTSEDRLYDETGCPWIVLYLAQNKPDSATPCEARMPLETAGMKDMGELPWSDLIGKPTSPFVAPQTGKKYVIRGASQLVIKPVFAVKDGQYWCNPSRLVLPYNYTDNDWVLASSARGENLGIWENLNKGILVDSRTARTLRMSDLGLGSSSEHILSNTTGGKKVPALTPPYSWNWWSSGRNGGSTMGTTTPTPEVHQNITNSQKTQLKSWLTNSANTIRGTKTYNTSGNTYAFKGGDQTFISDSKIKAFQDATIVDDIDNPANFWKLKITKKDYVSTKVCYFKYENGVIVNANNSDFPAIGATNSLKNNIVNADYFINPSSSHYTSYGGSQCYDGSINSDNIMVEVDYVSWNYEIEYIVVTGDLIQFNAALPTSRQNTNDSIYDVLAFPYGELNASIPKQTTPPYTDNVNFITKKEASLAAPRAIGAKLTNQVVYDVQMLPYCPYREVAEYYGQNGVLNFGIASPFALASWSGVYKITVPGESANRENAMSIGLWCHSSSGTFNIPHNIDVPDGSDPVEYKLFSFCKKFRLVGPNYASAFEFNPLKNNGVEGFNVDYNYRPYNPYVHIAPIFKEEGLYGPDLNDIRGLTLQGDFSIGFHSDAWANYQIQNANYANIFNRQMASLDVKQGIAQEQMDWKQTLGIVGAVTGIAGGAVTGAVKGAAGGPYAAIGGAILGAGTAGLGAGLALEGLNKQQDWLARSQAEERSYAIDMYNLNLGNVKALPLGLAKTDALTVNFKEAPFIETYDCTELEKEIFRNKLKYDGMSVNGIGTIQNYLPASNDYDFQKIKGRMIMLDYVTDDSHILNEIYNEVNKGFYYVPYVEPEEEDEGE